MNDTLALFESGAAFEPIPLVDADLQFAKDFYRPPLTHELMQALLEETAWRQEKIKLWGEEILQPRLSAWYGDAGSVYTYSGMTFQPLPWSRTMLRIKEDIERATGHRFNSVLLNLYRNERDSVGWHSDDERELGARPVIASLSLGETRSFRLRHKSRKNNRCRSH